MSQTGLNAFDRTIHITNTWLREIQEELGLPDHQHAYHAMRAVLHAVRDRLIPGEAADFAAQLPILVRGVFYEGYHPDNAPSRARRRAQFLDAVKREWPYSQGPSCDDLVRGVLTVVERHVAQGEMEEIRHQLPEEVRNLWKPTPTG